MSDSPTANRPRQVTVGAGVAGAASLVMLLSAGSILAKLHTVDLRQAVTEFLSKGAGRSLDIGVDQALAVARVGLMVLGAASAAMLVFAFFAARRDKGSRIAMSVLAVPLVGCGMFVDVFLTGFIVAATILLWTAPARDWFAGRAPRQVPVPAVPPREDVAPPPPPLTAPPPYAARYGESGAAAPVGAPAPAQADIVRPRPVVTACATTWAFCSLVAVFLVVALASLGSDPLREQFRTALAKNPQARELGITVSDLVTATAVVCALLLLWTLAAVVVAALVWRRQSWARLALVISAVVAGAMALVSSIAFPGFLLVVVACGTCVAMLVRREAVDWFRAR